jgi:hypothetical protein
MKTSDYLDLAQKKSGARNDNQLKKLLGWGDSKINNYRHNRQAMDNEAARQIAELLEVPVWQIIADMEIQRAKDEPTRKAWKMLGKLSKQGGRATANLLFLLPFPAFGLLHYILC